MEIRRGGTTPKSEIWLLDCPELSSDYSNTWDWSGNEQAEQQKYFKSRLLKNSEKYKFKNYSYIRKEQAIKLNIHIDDIHGANYIMYGNNENEWVYAFIIEKEYINENTTKIYIQTDLIQTYMHYFKLLDSFVDRCHVNRWTSQGLPTNEIENEGLEFGEYIQSGTETIKKFEESYIAVCSNPLGKIKTRPKKPDDPSSGGSKGDWKNGIVSADGFRFVKGFEAYAPYQYYDSGGVLTVGYGVTQRSEPDVFKKLTENPPASEELCAKESYKLKNERYGKPIVKACESLGITEQYQFDALVSLAFNSGTGSITGSNNLMNTIKSNPKDCDAIKAVWEKFKITDEHGQTQPGLIARRKEEAKMFCNEKYEVRSIPIYDKQGHISGTVTDNNGNGWLP